MSTMALIRLVVWHDVPAETVCESGGSYVRKRQPGDCWSVLRIAMMAAFFSIFGSAICAEEDAYTEGEKLFALKVKPLLKQKCFACHGGGEEIEGDLILTSREEMLLGGESSDEVLVPGNGNGSLLYQSTTRNTDE